MTEPVSPELEADPWEMTAEEIKTHLAEVAPIECGPDLIERALDHMNHPAVDAEPELELEAG